jgi:hypothetical protein
MTDRSLPPATVADADKPLRREVAMAHRTAREAGHSHHDALAAAKAVYYRVLPSTPRSDGRPARGIRAHQRNDRFRNPG